MTRREEINVVIDGCVQKLARFIGDNADDVKPMPPIGSEIKKIARILLNRIEPISDDDEEYYSLLGSLENKVFARAIDQSWSPS